MNVFIKVYAVLAIITTAAKIHTVNASKYLTDKRK